MTYILQLSIPLKISKRLHVSNIRDQLMVWFIISYNVWNTIVYNFGEFDLRYQFTAYIYIQFRKLLFILYISTDGHSLIKSDGNAFFRRPGLFKFIMVLYEDQFSPYDSILNQNRSVLSLNLMVLTFKWQKYVWNYSVFFSNEKMRTVV